MWRLRCRIVHVYAFSLHYLRCFVSSVADCLLHRIRCIVDSFPDSFLFLQRLDDANSLFPRCIRSWHIPISPPVTGCRFPCFRFALHMLLRWVYRYSIFAPTRFNRWVAVSGTLRRHLFYLLISGVASTLSPWRHFFLVVSAASSLSVCFCLVMNCLGNIFPSYTTWNLS